MEQIMLEKKEESQNELKNSIEKFTVEINEMK